jgi:hypothetical protein
VTSFARRDKEAEALYRRAPIHELEEETAAELAALEGAPSVLEACRTPRGVEVLALWVAATAGAALVQSDRWPRHSNPGLFPLIRVA